MLACLAEIPVVPGSMMVALGGDEGFDPDWLSGLTLED